MRATQGAAAPVYEFIQDHGASFFDDMPTACGCCREWRSVAELVALGLVNSDGFAGLRRCSCRAASARAWAAGGDGLRCSAWPMPAAGPSCPGCGGGAASLGGGR